MSKKKGLSVEEKRTKMMEFFYEKRKRKMDELVRKLDESEKKRKVTSKLIAKAKIGKDETEQRRQVLKELELKQNEKKRLLAELESYKECDPEVMEQMKRDVVVCKDSANRWTDNVFAIKS